jgi:hypothetical protein
VIRRGPLPLRIFLGFLQFIEKIARAIRRETLNFRIGLMTEALSDEERMQVSIDAYDQSFPLNRADAGLHEWEEAWFGNTLPKAPAKLLIAAAGSGREAVALQGLGYQVDVIEPATAPVNHCKSRLAETSLVVQADFADLTAAVLEATDNSASRLADSYDAIILGWGGLAHVLRHDDRIRLLCCCDRLTKGPVLASFFMDPHASERQQVSTAAKVGSRTGRAIAGLRGLPQNREPVEYTEWGGFIRHLRPEDLDEIGKVAGRIVQWQKEGGFPHATFVSVDE